MKRVKRISIIWIMCSCLMYTLCFAKGCFDTVPIGKVELGNEVFIYEAHSYPVWQVKEQLFLTLGFLRQMGMKVEELDGVINIEDNRPEQENEIKIIPMLQDELAHMRKQSVYCGNIRSFALDVKDEVLIPIEALQGIGHLINVGQTYWLEENLFDPLKVIKMDEEGILNQTDHIVSVLAEHLYWNGTDYEVVSEPLILEAREKIAWQIDTKKLYISTFISKINGLEVKEASKNYGQRHHSIFSAYSEGVRYQELSSTFPTFIIEAEMKYGVGPFKPKEHVTLCRSESRTYFWIKGQDDKKYQVPYQSVRIIGERGARLKKVTNKDIEDFARLSGINSETDYLIWTDIYRQRTYVLRKEGEKWHLEKNLVCSTGKNNNPTPTGVYEVQYMIPYIGIEKGYRCKYALVFFRDYMFHSILFDKSGKYIKSGQYELGSKASHGCIRLSEKDSAWLYQHIPVKTKVWIR